MDRMEQVKKILENKNISVSVSVLDYSKGEIKPAKDTFCGTIVSSDVDKLSKEIVSALYSEPQVDKAYLNFEPPEKPQVCPACKGSGQAHYQRGLNDTPAIVEIRDCPDCNGTGCIPVPSTPAIEGMLKFNNALEADALDWDTRNIKSKFTSEEILGHIEVLSKSFYDKYAGKGLTPSEVMELHKSEYWELVINFIEAPLRAEIAELKAKRRKERGNRDEKRNAKELQKKDMSFHS